MTSESEIRERSIALYRSTVAEFDILVQAMKVYAWPNELQLVRMQRVAIGILIIHTLQISKAILALLESGQSGSILSLVRGQFEMGVKLYFIEKHPQKGGDFLLSEPFERYWLAKDYAISEKRLATIIVDCNAVVANNPGLCKYQTKQNRGRRAPDFRAIRNGLKFPPMRDMIIDLGWDLDLYVTVFLFGSLDTHGSINQLRRYVEGIDAVPRFVTELDPEGPPDFILQSLAYVLGMIGAIGNWFTIREEELMRIKPLWEEHNSIKEALFGRS